MKTLTLLLLLASDPVQVAASPSGVPVADTVEARYAPEAVADAVSPGDSVSRGDPRVRSEREATTRADFARVVGATFLYSALYPDVRGPLMSDGSISRVGDHLRRPIGSAVDGAREDDDPFFTNYVAHPLSWGAIGYYFRTRGHSPGVSLLMSQGHSVFWEYVLEGSYQKPSGKDLITNLVSAWLGILVAGHGEDGNATVRLELRTGPELPPPTSADPGPVRGGPGSGVTLAIRVPI